MLQGRIPDWAWSNWRFSLEYLNLSHNLMTNVDSIPHHFVDTIDLLSNFLKGLLPIPPDSTKYLFISQNNLSEEIPSSICSLTSLVLDMHHNSLSGILPNTFRIGCTLKTFNFHGNNLEGKIPQSLINCKQLEVLDVGDNHLNDTFPLWLGTQPMLKVLSMRSNKLHGSIRNLTTENLSPQLLILALSYNVFTGNLPTSLFLYLKAMRTIDQIMNAPRDKGYRYYQDSVAVVTKVFEREIVRILFLYTTVDLSNNKFEGSVPSILGDLVTLCMLNLSHNELQGHIPLSLGNLSVVESLDLSGNHLIGEIPTQFVSLKYLEVLNLSHNHLKGFIPQGNQFHAFENNSYEGNDGLYGFPLSKGCVNDCIWTRRSSKQF
ncbi:hypothetical protein P3L10_015957 [Capsicum annuum]